MNNPLYEPQREIAGSTTLEKYFYQYHWALHEALEKLLANEKYIVFMEVHEDVVFCNSHDDTGTFSFFQIKETDKKTLSALYKIVKTEKNSILGKCLLSVHGKSYKDKVTSIAIVVSKGFNFKNLLKNETNLNVIGINDFEEDSVDKLIKAMKQEISEDVDLSTIQFMSSDLSVKFEPLKMQVVGKINILLKQFFPNAYYQAQDAYVVLIDSLLRQGTCSKDFVEWDDFVKHKGLKSDDIRQVLESHTSVNFENIRCAFDDISDNLNIKGFNKTRYRKKLEKLHTDIFGLQSKHLIHYAESVDRFIDSQGYDFNFLDSNLIDEIAENITIDDYNVDIKALSIYCIIRKVIDEIN